MKINRKLRDHITAMEPPPSVETGDAFFVGLPTAVGAVAFAGNYAAITCGGKHGDLSGAFVAAAVATEEMLAAGYTVAGGSFYNRKEMWFVDVYYGWEGDAKE